MILGYIIYFFVNFYYKTFNINILQNADKICPGDWGLGIGDWGLGIGDLGIGDWPNPQSPIPNPH